MAKQELKKAHGYFFKSQKPKEGELIDLPINHTQQDRLIAAKKANIPDYDYCVFMFSNESRRFISGIPDVDDLFYGTNHDGDTRILFQDSSFKIIRETPISALLFQEHSND